MVSPWRHDVAALGRAFAITQDAHLCAGTKIATATSLSLYYKMYYKDAQLEAVATREGRTSGTVRGYGPAAMRGARRRGGGDTGALGLVSKSRRGTADPLGLYYK